MKTKSMILPVLAISATLFAQSCSGPTYVESTPPPPPVYTQPAPPPPTYVQQTPPPTYAETTQDQAPPPVNYQSFYDELSPYGQWVTTPEYGYVWIPAAGADFQPYGTCGHWVLTNYGWTWASDYSWGWAAFHYGSWEYDGTMGWYWIPGYQWSPAWVNWRSCNGYYGWAPLGPNYVSGGYATYNCPPERYVFVNATYMGRANIATYYEPRNQNTTYYGRSSVVTNTYYDRGSNATYYAGPQRTDVERYTKTPVREVSLVQTSSPERDGNSGNEMRMYRPSVQQPVNNQVNRPAPQKLYQRTEVAPVQQRQVLTQPNQPRATPYRQENTQHQGNQPNEQNRQQQHPANQQQAPVQQQQPARQQQAPVQQQQPARQQQAPVQRQQPAKQQPQQKTKQVKPQQRQRNKPKPQPKAQPQQGQQPQGRQ